MTDLGKCRFVGEKCDEHKLYERQSRSGGRGDVHDFDTDEVQRVVALGCGVYAIMQPWRDVSVQPGDSGFGVGCGFLHALRCHYWAPGLLVWNPKLTERRGQHLVLHVHLDYFLLIECVFGLILECLTYKAPCAPHRQRERERESATYRACDAGSWKWPT